MEMEYMQVISLINVVYVIKGLDGMETCRDTLEHIQDTAY
jgi:hypothetical protein